MVANNNNNNINNSDRKKKKIIIEGINIYMELEWVHCRLSYCQKREKNIRDRKKYNKQKHKTNKNGNYNNQWLPIVQSCHKELILDLLDLGTPGSVSF